MHNRQRCARDRALAYIIVQRFGLFGNGQFKSACLLPHISFAGLDKLGVMAFMVTVRDEREEAEIMKYVGVHDVNMGKGRVRKSFATIDEVVEMPDLIEVQKNSYERFLKEDLREVLNDVSPIYDFNGNLKLEFVDYSLDKTPKYSLEECRERDMTYATALKVLVRLTNNETGEVKESEVFMGDFPLMTEHGTFIINGGERVIVSQLVRSPGVYYRESIDKAGKHLFDTQVIPSRGAWLEYEIDSNDVIWVRVDRARKLPVTSLLRALGYGSDEQIRQLLGNDEKLEATMQRDGGDDGTRRTRGGNEVKSKESGLMDIYRRLRPGEVGTVDSAEKLLHATFFDPKRYDMMRVGRYKYNKKLAIAARIRGHVVDQDIIDPTTGEVIIAAGERIPAAKTDPLAKKIQDAGVNDIYLRLEDRVVRVIGNNFVDAAAWLSEEEIEKAGINEMVHLPTLKQLLETAEQEGMDELAKIRLLHENLSALMPKHILIDDIVASISYLLNLPYGVGLTDDIDHLGNRRLRSVGELLQNQIRIGLSRLERVVRERMAIQDADEVRPGELINIRPVTAAIKEFFGSSPLSQFMDQTNPLAELTHKRRLSALGPGGLSRERANMEVRDVHYSHYGRMCPIETPEGPNIGLISYLASYAKINEYGFVEAPYRKVKKIYDENNNLIEQVVTDEVEYMTADVEDEYVVAQANEPLDEGKHFVRPRVSARRRDEILEIDAEKVDYMDVSPRMMVSVATACIPFLENDDCNRALMGSNMQRQAVPLMVTQQPIVATGMEYKAATDSGTAVLAKSNGVVEKVDADHIVVRNEQGALEDYSLIKFARSNAGTCINQRPIVEVGETVKISYVDQNRSGIDPDKNLWEVVSDGLDHMMVGETEVPSRAYVASFGFKGQDQQKRAGVLSGGERNRLNLALTLKQGGNLLLLDEPTNDLDVETLSSLEAALLEFPGCSVVISHDRMFLDRVATHILAWEGTDENPGNWYWFEGNFEAYQANRIERLGEDAAQPHRIHRKLTRD